MIQTDEAFTVEGRKHTQPHTHARARARAWVPPSQVNSDTSQNEPNTSLHKSNTSQQKSETN